MRTKWRYCRFVLWAFVAFSCDSAVETSAPVASDSSDAPWSGIVIAVHGTEGAVATLTASGEGASAQPLARDQAVPAGATVTTDAQSRVELKLKGGATVTVDHGTSLTLVQDRARSLRVDRGRMVFSRTHEEAAPSAELLLPTGMVVLQGLSLIHI